MSSDAAWASLTWLVKKWETASAISLGVTSASTGQSLVSSGLMSTGGRPPGERDEGDDAMVVGRDKVGGGDDGARQRGGRRETAMGRRFGRV